MSEIILCNKPMKADTLRNLCGIESDTIIGALCRQPTMLNAYTPYILGTPSRAAQSVVNQLTTTAKNRELTNLSLSFGGDNIIGIADMTTKLRELGIGSMGASTSVYANRVGGFADAVKNYQAALMEYRHAIETKSAVKGAFKQKAIAAFDKMQQGFQHELRAVTAATKSRRGTALTSSKRATDIARSSRNVTKLNVMSQVQASNLVKFSQHAKFFGNGIAVIDFGSRIGNIRNSYKAGGNWEREMFIESSSFATSAIAGSLVVDAGISALTFMMVATPVGWVGLIVGGLAVAGVAAGSAMWVNGQLKENSGAWYDEIMNWIS